MADEAVVVGAYRLGRRIGEGRMGVVYVATHRERPGRFAVKVMHPHLAEDENKVGRLRRLSEAAANLVHPNIAQVYEFGETEDGGAHIAMEYCEGSSLDQYLARQRLSVVQAVDLLIQIVQALSHAHRHGIVHRDLKPANIMIAWGDGAELVVKVLDFDMARFLGGTQARDHRGWEGGLTLDWEIVGTPGYMSPEQARHLEVDPRSDLYALGCIAYEILVGAPLFFGAPWEVMLAHASQLAAPPSSRGVVLPPELEELVMACLAKKIEERPASADELLQRLDRLRDG